MTQAIVPFAQRALRNGGIRKAFSLLIESNMNITLKHIGKSADDLRFFIHLCGAHAGGITVHSIEGDRFSYGVAVTETKRRRGVASAALTELFAFMKARGFTKAVVQVAPEHAASLALHRALGFTETARDAHAVTLTRTL